MFLSRVTLKNLRAFWNSDAIDLASGVTLLFGKNNSGKTTLLEALGTGIAEGIHNGPQNSPAEGEFRNRDSSMELELQVDVADLQGFVRSAGDYSLIADPQRDTAEAATYSYHDRVLTTPFRLTMRLGANGTQPQALPSYVPPFSTAPQELAFSEGRQVAILRFRRDATATRGYIYIGFDMIAWPQIHGYELSFQLYSRYRTQVFRFQAERRPEPKMPITFEMELSSDARNLVTVLNTLISERERFSEYESHVQRILPEIGEILSVPSGTPGVAEIKIAMSERKGRRDLTYNLTQIGTGAVQVLALVYAITMSRAKRLILLDEPTAFLHPGAARELLKLTSEFSEHQYVIGTHMPLALDMLSAPRVILLERTTEGTIRSQCIEYHKVAQQRLLLREIGSSLQDVFGADHVVWVEGPTEAEVYRLVMQITPQLPRGVAVLPIVHTGDLQRRDRVVLAEIYERLSTGGALLPASVSFILDSECRNEQEVKELQRRTSNRIFFTKGGRMLENVFLEPALIARFISEACADWIDPGPATADISTYWDSLNDNKRYAVSYLRSADSSKWHAEVHGARVLEDTVARFSDAKLQYRKIKHGRRLAELCLQSEFSHLLGPLVLTLKEALELKN